VLRRISADELKQTMKAAVIALALGAQALVPSEPRVRHSFGAVPRKPREKKSGAAPPGASAAPAAAARRVPARARGRGRPRGMGGARAHRGSGA